MTSLHFKDDNRKLGFGQTATHWTKESMKHCTCISGTFSTDPLTAAKEYFYCEQTDCDGNNMDYWDGEDLLKETPISIDVYGLVLIDNSYYWTKEVKTITFSLSCTLEDNP
jgi:hypothetical protein